MPLLNMAAALPVAQFLEDRSRSVKNKQSFGECWTVHDEPTCYELFWLEESAELCLIRWYESIDEAAANTYAATLVLQGFLNWRGRRRYPAVGWLLGTIDYRELVDKVLEGWEAAQNNKDSLRWIMERIQSLPLA